MTTVFHAWPYGRFIEIQRNLRRKKLHRTNQGPNFLGGSFSIEIMSEPQSNLEEKVNHSFSKDYFSSRRTHPFSNQQHQCYQTGQAKPVEFFQHSNQQGTSCLNPQCLTNQIQVQKPVLVIAVDQMPDHIQSREQYHQHRQQYYR